MQNSSFRRNALGRGLASLIPQDSEEKGSENEIVMIDTGSIRPNPFQPRTEFVEEEINELAQSIRAQGLLQPVIVRKRGDGYEIVSGERRVRAMRVLGCDKVPSIVRPKIADREMLEVALVENVQRENLDEIELANAYQKLLLDCGLSHEQLSERIGKSRSVITNTLRLLKLPKEVQEALHRKKISMGHARALLALKTEQEQKRYCSKIISDGLTVRDIENLAQLNSSVSTAAKERKKSGTGQRPDPDTLALIEKLQHRFGTQTAILIGKKGHGTIQFYFYTQEDLNRILDLMLNRQSG
jgi:ParB family chromosome partitioning protein